MSAEIGESEFAERLESENQIDWSAYSEHYDALCLANPAYQELLDDFSSKVGQWGLSKHSRICDFGAGTGSFMLAAAKSVESAELHHVDFDPGMSAKAREKYADADIHVAIHQTNINDFNFPGAEFDLSICVNTLYSLPNHLDALRVIRKHTKPGGRLYIVDFGRKVELLDWAIFILRNRVKELGLRKTIGWYRENAENLAQNRRGAKAQAKGTYWLHSPKEFESALVESGWQIEEIDSCYRDCCDRALCINPP